MTSSLAPERANGGMVAVTTTAATLRSRSCLRVDLDAEPAQERLERLRRERRRHVVARAVEPGDDAVAEQLVVPDADDVDQISQAVGACIRGEGARETHDPHSENATKNVCSGHGSHVKKLFRLKTG